MNFPEERFVNPVEDEYKCMICFEVLSDPNTVCAQDHLCCLACATASLQLVCPSGVSGLILLNMFEDQKLPEPPLCPLCSTPVELRPSMITSRKIDDLPVYCEHQQLGCRWVCPKRNIIEHQMQVRARVSDDGDKEDACRS
ncbi:hypothetical protein RQP46_011223 [Phenoliferia psychrophenolica]